MKAQKVCDCQNVSFDWSIYINEFWLQHRQNICENCIFNIFSQQSLVFSVLYSNELSLKFSCKFFQQCVFWNFFNDVIFSTMWLFQRCDFFSDALFGAFEQTSSAWYDVDSNDRSCIDAKNAETNESRFDDLLISDLT